ncbi:MAG TPA: pyridoxal phosphate-dependent aminotransferase [Leptospiraceae bacterium]|nr:pyridoxal phosphate-dependent aminotransferase [Leptospiraceae bacterium]HMX35246.1 pyridoxal phosphate-dependent aminotransferase [Leptospiraceae bacterium]HMY31266.1 pyridoxal phosphate-dependent aminotransferase [Leptospiraceae bacterium]HMZ67521.1 pyridoxal phosphate-dependent aminotransferase [Leptospiraceae bacterium]HNA10343.1 pyridoxal phosphate-dependent aminotransferase [Leptospiraceae bacterium]
MNYLSDRFDFERSENELSRILELTKNNADFLDLTISNPTSLFHYDLEKIQKGLNASFLFPYSPDPFGIESAREILVKYYQSKGRIFQKENFFFASGTSEAMSFILKAIANRDSEVLLPTPGYPLYDFILKLENVKTEYYALLPRKVSKNQLLWEIDFSLLEQKINKNTKALVIVEPQNPTGARLTKSDAERLVEVIRKNKLILIIDEVFSDYYKDYYLSNPYKNINCIYLNGLSKTLALPQMKLSWIYLSGEAEFISQMKESLEIICDTYLSVNSMVQYGLGFLLETAVDIQSQIINQIQVNLELVERVLMGQDLIEWFKPEGGWYLLLRINNQWKDEDFSIQLLKEKHVYILPGYMFDIHEEGYIVISLIVKSNILEEGLNRILAFIHKTG